MARVNHKLVKQRLNEQRSKISDRQFFSSVFWRDILKIWRQHRQGGIAITAGFVSICIETERKACGVNGQYVCAHQYWKFSGYKGKGRENRYQIVCGLFAHELGHVLYTDFLAAQTHTNYLGSGRWYPYPPDLKTTADARNEKAFWNYVKTDPKIWRWCR